MAEEREVISGASLWSDAWKRLLKNHLAVVGMVILALMLIAVIVGPQILYMTTGLTADAIPADGNLIKSFPPSGQHIFGTDEAGRDLLARVLQGGRISLMVGIISTIVSLAVGVSYGAIAGYLGGSIDNVMMRLVDIIYAIPYILIVIVLLKVFGGTNTPLLVTWVPSILVGAVLLLVGLPAAVAVYRSAGEYLHGRMKGFAFSLTKFAIGLIETIILLAIVWSAASFVSNTSAGTWLSDKYTNNVDQSLSQIFLLFFALGMLLVRSSFTRR
jgi:ABC-type dipeptide/oligopeptide/nickel transport system permease subunit